MRCAECQRVVDEQVRASLTPVQTDRQRRPPTDVRVENDAALGVRVLFTLALDPAPAERDWELAVRAAEPRCSERGFALLGCAAVFAEVARGLRRELLRAGLLPAAVREVEAVAGGSRRIGVMPRAAEPCGARSRRIGCDGSARVSVGRMPAALVKDRTSET